MTEPTAGTPKGLSGRFRRTMGLPWTGYRVRLLRKCSSVLSPGRR
nr:MAG TPA: hypothetical protein [Bacteriophage sp.]